MSASVVTYAELEDAVKVRADVVAGTGQRWTSTKLQAAINRSLKKWNQLLVDAGDDTYLKISRVQTSPSSTISADGWAPRQYIAQPAGLFAIRGIDIYPSGNMTPISMLTFDEAERNDKTLRGYWWNEVNTSMPRFYRLGGMDSTTSLIQLYPWADGIYTCDIRYIPAFPPALASTSYDFVCGGEEFVILDAAMQVLVPDGRAGTAEYIAGLREEREQVKQEVTAALARRGSFRRRDTWLERRNLQARWRWWSG